MTYKEYENYMSKRRNIISKNRSNRLKGLPQLKVPPKINPPTCLVVYEPDGTYYGRINDLSELPNGYKVKTELAQY